MSRRGEAANVSSLEHRTRSEITQGDEGWVNKWKKIEEKRSLKGVAEGGGEKLHYVEAAAAVLRSYGWTPSMAPPRCPLQLKMGMGGLSPL